MRILQGRRSRLEERLDGVRAAFTRMRTRMDDYTIELQRHGLESVEREVRWLNELIATERRSQTGPQMAENQAGQASLQPQPKVTGTPSLGG